jgi:hypothetical protein
MAGKHTSGPWTVVEHSWSDIGVYAGAHRVCLLSIYDEATEETQSELEARDSANARLIAAAPELLEALQTLVRNRYSCFIPEDGSVAELYEWTEKARDLIARATQPLPTPNEE